MPTATDVLRIARAEIGNRSGKKYWDFYFKGSMVYVNGNATPYCACFVSWVLNQAKAKCSGLPASYCPYICRDGTRAGKRVSKYAARPGDIVLFDFNGDSVSDHVGIVESNQSSYLQTIEGNTSGGIVTRRTRYFSQICHVIRPDYSKTTTMAQADDSLVVDGWAGPLTILKLQDQLALPTVYRDGVLSGQNPAKKPFFDHVWSCTWEGLGSQTVEALQSKIGANPDGYWGYLTSMALQNYLIARKYDVGPDGADGYFGYNSVCALQKALNEGALK